MRLLKAYMPTTCQLHIFHGAMQPFTQHLAIKQFTHILIVICARGGQGGVKFDFGGRQFARERCKKGVDFFGNSGRMLRFKVVRNV